MIDIIPGIEKWLAEKKTFALATVIQTWRSAPRMIGSSMAISKDMEILGSVSGGCVEGNVMKEAEEVLRIGVPKRLSYGVTDEDAWTVGLSCGGRIDVWLEPFMTYETGPREKEIWPVLEQSVKNNQGCALVSNLSSDSWKHCLVYPDGTSVGAPISNALTQMANEAYSQHKNQIVSLSEGDVFINVFSAKSRLVIIGAAHVSVDLVAIAHQFNFETIVVDPRGIFSDKDRFATPPDELHKTGPAEILPELKLDSDTYLVVLTHDPKIDDQALHIALKSEMPYIGALGSKKTHAKRSSRLMEAGFSQEQIERIHAPVGVAINARQPKEIALSIVGELIQAKNQYM
ncbi:MAG: XdhC family protein [Cyclobacteriaceae bacterium]